MLRVFVVLYSLFTIRITHKSLCISVWCNYTHAKVARGAEDVEVVSHQSDIMSSLWGRLLWPGPATLPSPSLSPGRCPWRDEATRGEISPGSSQSGGDSSAPFQCPAGITLPFFFPLLYFYTLLVCILFYKLCPKRKVIQLSSVCLIDGNMQPTRLITKRRRYW